MKLKNKIGNLIEIDWANDLHELQPDNVKIPINIEYLKNSILQHGFALPFAVWNDNGKCYCVDGHTRKQILLELISDGVEVPAKLKAFEILAKDRSEAIKILVEVYNQKHNPFAEEVLTEWLEAEEIEMEEVVLEGVNISQSINSDFNLDDFFSDNEENNNLNRFKIVLEYTEEDYNKIMTAFEKYTGSKENVIYKLLIEQE